MWRKNEYDFKYDELNEILTNFILKAFPKQTFYRMAKLEEQIYLKWQFHTRTARIKSEAPLNVIKYTF